MAKKSFFTIAIFLAINIIYFAIVIGLKLQANYAESNYSTNLIRIQNILNAPETTKKKVVLVGSSFTGRLGEKNFNSEVYDLKNFGLDGCGVFFGVLLLQKMNKIPDVLMLEGNLLFDSKKLNEKNIWNATESFTFKLARHLPFLQQKYRPSSVLYSLLKNWKDAPDTQKNKLNWTPEQLTEHNYEKLGNGTTKHSDNKFNKLIQQLKQSGTKVMIYSLPSGKKNDFSKTAWQKVKQDSINLSNCAQNWGIEFWDMQKTFFNQQISYSDGRHLDTASATEILKIIQTMLNN